MTLFYIILATAVVSLVSIITLSTVFNAIKKPHIFKSIISLAAGALLTVAMTDLLPEALHSGLFSEKVILGTTLLSMLFFFILERFFHWHHCCCTHHSHSEHHHDFSNKKSLIWTNLTGDALHNILDGFLIAAAFLLDPLVGVITTAAIVLHEIPQEVGDFGVLLHAGLSKKKALLYNFGIALTAIVGAVVFYYVGEQVEHIIPLMAAFAAGNFIYLALADLVPELHHEQNQKNVVRQTIALFIGVGLMLGINFLLPHDAVHADDHGHAEELHHEQDTHGHE